MVSRRRPPRRGAGDGFSSTFLSQMNERDLRLLQAAAAAADSTVHEADDALDAVDDDNMELVVADLSADEINAALQALVGEMEGRHDDKSQDFQPPPARSTSNPNTAATNKFDFDTTEDSLENLKRLLGLDDNPALDTIDDLRQHNGSVVASGMDQSRPIDHEGHLADLQRSLTELPNPTTRTNSPPTQGSTMTEVDPQATANLVNWLSALVGPSTDTPAPPAPAPPAQPRGRTRQSPIPDPFEDPVKAAERDRIRVENRERKKKWRTQNQERSKSPPLVHASYSPTYAHQRQRQRLALSRYQARCPTLRYVNLRGEDILGRARVQPPPLQACHSQGTTHHRQPCQ